MEKRTILAWALALAAPLAGAAEFDGTVYFGDSLTDAGTFGARFTTNPGPVWAQLLSERLGASSTNLAVGGARITLLPGVPNSPPTDNAPPLTTQIDSYLATSAVDAGALHTFWGGANDVFVASALGAGAVPYLQQTAGEAAAQIARLQASGARYILVPNVPDIGTTPFGVSQGPAGSAALTQLSAAYNSALYAEIAARGLRVIPLDVFTLLNEVLADPSAYGFANVSLPACGATPSLLCTPADLIDPAAAQTFLFADGVHPTTAGHSVLADYAASVLAAPGQISILPETALKARIALVDRLYVRLREPGRGRGLWVSADAQRTGIDDAKGNGAGLAVGADLFRSAGSVLGAALGFSSSKPRFGGGGHYRQEEIAVSLYGGWSGGPWQLGATLAYGALQHEVDREIRLGAATRTATGSPDGRNVSAGIEGAYRFSGGRLTHGPLASLLVQQARLDAFTEQGGGSAGLRYGAQKRSSAIGRLGWQAAYDAGGWAPYARASLDRELHDKEREVEAQLATAPEMPAFSLPAARPGRSYATLLAGSSFRLAPGWSANAGISHVISQSHAKATGVFATLSAEF